MSSELQRAVLHGQAAAVQALLLRPLIDGTVEELERKQASRAEPEARLRAAERALADSNAAEREATKARVAAEKLYHTIQSECAEWLEQHVTEQERAAGSPRSDTKQDVVIATGAGSPRLLTEEQVQAAWRRKIRSSEVFASPLAMRAVLPTPWEPLPKSDSRLSAEEEEQVRTQAQADLDAKVAAGQASSAEIARLRQHSWMSGIEQLRKQRVGRVLHDPDAVKSLYDVQSNPPWVQETKALLGEWAHAHNPDDAQSEEWAGGRIVPVKVAKLLFEALMEVGPNDTGCDSWQSEVQWVIGMLADAASRRAKRPGERGLKQMIGPAPSVHQLKNIFGKVDRNRDGEISRAELILRLRKDAELATMLGLPSHLKDEDREEFEALFQGMDSDLSGNIDCDEFVRYFSRESSGQQLGGGCSLDSILTELLVLGRATACLPAQFSQDQVAEYVARVLDPLNSLKRYGWYKLNTMADIGRTRASEAHRILQTAQQVEYRHADEVEDATDDIKQYKEQLEEIGADISELNDRIALYKGPIDGIRGRLREQVSAADSDYTGVGGSAEAGKCYRTRDVALNCTEMRTLAPVPGSSLVLVAAWRGHIEVLEVLLALQADPNRAAPDGSTPLYMAAGTGRADIVTTLLKAGAEPGRMKSGGFSPLWNAAMQREHGGTPTPWPRDWKINRNNLSRNAEELAAEHVRLDLCCPAYRNSFVVKESTRLLASEVGKRPESRLRSDPDSLATVAALLGHGQRKVDAARAHREKVAKALVVDLRTFTSMSDKLAKQRDQVADMEAICEQLRAELEELKATAIADEDDSDEEDGGGEPQALENRQSARRKWRSAITVTKLAGDLQHRRTAQEIRQRWKVSAVLGSEFSRRSRSPDPMDRSDTLWTAAAAASAKRHFRVWTCSICGKRRIPVDLSECPLCGKEKPPGPDPCPDFDDWKRVVDDDSGDEDGGKKIYWVDVTGKKESRWDPPPGWEDEFYRRTSKVKPKSREGRQLAKLEKRKEKLAAGKISAVPRPQVGAEEMARFAAVFATVDADGSGTVSLQELANAVRTDSGLARMLNLRDHLDNRSKHLVDQSDAELTRQASVKRLFEAMDRNKDGSVTKEEFLGFVASGKAKQAAGGVLGWQIMRKKMPWVIEAEKLVEEWVEVVDKDGNGLVGKREAKSMLRALAEFRAFYAAALLKEAGMQQASKRRAGTHQQPSQQQPQNPDPALKSAPEPEPETNTEPAAVDGEDKDTQSKAKQSNQLFSSINQTREKRLMCKKILSTMFRQADRDGNGQITRAELIASLRRNKDMATVLDLPQKITDQERAAFERVFQAMDRDDDRTIDEREFIKFFSTGKAAAAAFRLGVSHRQSNLDTEDVSEEWEWEDLLAELDEDNDGQLSAKELMGLFVDIDPKNYTQYTTCVLKPLQELKHNGWFDPATMTKLCLKRLGQAETKLGQCQVLMKKAEQHCTEATQQVQQTAKTLANADTGVLVALQYVGEYLNFAVGSSGMTVLHFAAARGDMPLLNLLLPTDSLDVNKAKISGATALHCAAANGHVQAVQALLDAGADLNVLDGSGRSVDDRARQCALATAREVEMALAAARLQQQIATRAPDKDE